MLYVGAISITESVKNTEENMKKQIVAVATVEFDYGSLMRNAEFLVEGEEMEMPYIKPEEIDKIGSLEQVKHYDYSLTFGMESKDVKMHMSEELENMLNQMTGYEYSNSFTLEGSQNPENIDLKESKVNLVSGRLLTEAEMNDVSSNKILISKKVAELNNFVVGEKIELEISIYRIEEMEENMYSQTAMVDKVLKFEFEIVRNI